MRDLKILIHDLISEKKWRNYFFLFLLAPIISFLVFDGTSDQPEPEKENINPVAFDTLIPSGFTLFPIEVANLDSINSFVGQFAITDVYTATLTNALASQLVAQNVKLLRSQVNSQQLALLIPAYAVGHFMKYPQPYALVIHQQSQDLEFKLPIALSSKSQIPEITYFE
jgi:hypothetical protein